MCVHRPSSPCWQPPMLLTVAQQKFKIKFITICCEHMDESDMMTRTNAQQSFDKLWDKGGMETYSDHDEVVQVEITKKRRRRMCTMRRKDQTKFETDEDCVLEDNISASEGSVAVSPTSIRPLAR